MLNRLRLLAVASVTASASLVAADDWKPEMDPRSIPTWMFEIEPSLEVTVWASTPYLYNPTNMDIDHAGAIWVAEGVNYRGRNGTRPAGDRIAVLRDTDGDGKCDSSHTFVQETGLIAPLGVAVFDNVVYVSQPPDLLAYTDVDRDLVFDPAVDKREVILTGFNAINHDHGLHSLSAGPDGKFYFNNGNCGAVFTDMSGKTFYMGGTYGGHGPNWPADHMSTSGKTSDDGHIWTSGFAVRMDPDGSKVEIVSHGLRNSYEQTLSSFGDMFQNDNDDPAACRTSFALEYGCAGYYTRDAKQRNKAVKRPGQSYARVHWRQDDPGTMDAGDVYGGGSPTGITFYENGALDAKWNGLLLSCESARNTIFGYMPTPRAGTFNLERFDFVTSNPEKRFAGADFSAGDPKQNQSVDKIAPTFFRPSDVTVGPDGAIYFCDWFDPRIGASAHMDESFSGTIYRIAPRNFNPVIPEFDLSTTEGRITALRSPAINTRYLGFRALKARGAEAFPAVSYLLEDRNKWIAARAVWLLPYLGDEGVKTCVEMLEHERAEQRVLAYRALRRAGHDIVPHARRMSVDPSPQVRREIALSLRDIPANRTTDIFVELAKRCDTTDKNSVEAIGLGAAKQEGLIWTAIKEGLKPGKPAEWPDSFARLTWRLWGAASIDDLKARSLDPALSIERRKLAVESIGFIDDARAAKVMLELASDGSPVKAEAAAWLMRNLVGEWGKYGIGQGLKEKGIYDPEAITVNACPVPVPPDNAKLPPVADILKLKGDAKRGKVAAARCVLCHQIDGNGTDYGPNLKGWGATQSLETIVRSIAEPSAEIALGYIGTEVVLEDGGIIHGIAFNNSDLWLDKALPLVIQSAGGITQLVPKDRIKKKNEFKRSLMYDPATLGLKAQDIADIAAWLQNYR
ncbi:MAG: putative membrane-bound dehydrogenase-like protein [Verrucomicrobiales bacterium]|jgi:putative membrane-bound dehydrogenase-like protein